VDAIKHERVVDGHVLLDEQLYALLSGYTADVRADIVDFAHAEAQDLSQVFLLDRLLLDGPRNRITLFPHQRILSIFICVVLTWVLTLSSEVLERPHDGQPLNRASLVLEFVANRGPVRTAHLLSDRSHMSESALFDIFAENEPFLLIVLVAFDTFLSHKCIEDNKQLCTILLRLLNVNRLEFKVDWRR
jgi:hypothetical protein